MPRRRLRPPPPDQALSAAATEPALSWRGALRPALRTLDLSGATNDIGRRGWRALHVAIATSNTAITSLGLPRGPFVRLDALFLPQLEVLSATCCALDGVLCGDAPRLRNLAAGCNQDLTGVGAGLLPPARLQYLDLSCCRGALRALPDVSRLTALRELRLDDLPLARESIVRTLPPLPALEVLGLSCCDLETLPGALVQGGCPRVRELQLGGNACGFAALTPAALPRLATLGLENINVDALELPAQLHRFTALTALNLADNRGLRGLPPLPPALTTLNLDRNYGLKTLPARLPTALKVLRLSGNYHIDTAALPPGLEELALVDSALARTVQWGALPRLRVLDLSGNAGLVLPDGTRLEELEELYMANCELEAGAGPDVGTMFPRLRKFVVSENPIVSLSAPALDLEELAVGEAVGVGSRAQLSHERIAIVRL